MTSMKLIRWALSTALTIAIAIPIILMAGRAEARRWTKGYYSETYEFNRPVRGYEGFLFPDYYCSYKRYPKRVCSYDKRGHEICRIKGWTLEQTCQ